MLSLTNVINYYLFHYPDIYLLVVSYDFIKSMIPQIIVNFTQILVWTLRSYNMSVDQLSSHLDHAKQSYRL